MDHLVDMVHLKGLVIRMDMVVIVLLPPLQDSMTEDIKTRRSMVKIENFFALNKILSKNDVLWNSKLLALLIRCKFVDADFPLFPGYRMPPQQGYINYGGYNDRGMNRGYNDRGFNDRRSWNQGN